MSASMSASVSAASRVVEVRLGRRAFAQWNTARDRWTVAEGTYRIRVGEHSRRLPLEARVAMGGR